MKKNIVLKIITTIIMMTITITFINCNISLADKEYIDSNGKIITDDWIPASSGSESKLVKKIGPILGYINVIGIVISVITISIIGLKYMMGSVEEKAEYKKTLGVYMLGIALLVFGTTIPNIIYNWTKFIFP